MYMSLCLIFILLKEAMNFLSFTMILFNRKSITFLFIICPQEFMDSEFSFRNLSLKIAYPYSVLVSVQHLRFFYSYEWPFRTYSVELLKFSSHSICKNEFQLE